MYRNDVEDADDEQQDASNTQSLCDAWHFEVGKEIFEHIKIHTSDDEHDDHRQEKHQDIQPDGQCLIRERDLSG